MGLVGLWGGCWRYREFPSRKVVPGADGPDGHITAWTTAMPPTWTLKNGENA